MLVVFCQQWLTETFIAGLERTAGMAPPLRPAITAGHASAPRLTPCSSATMLLYPVQSGTLHAACLHARREPLLAAAASLRASCAAMAACLESNQPITEALQVSLLCSSVQCIGWVAR